MTTQPFNPDWTVAPAALLREAMAERHHTTRDLATKMALTSAQPRALAVYHQAITDTLARQPMPAWLPDALDAAGYGSHRTWANLETQYRADLAAGRTDTTEEPQ